MEENIQVPIQSSSNSFIEKIPIPIRYLIGAGVVWIVLSLSISFTNNYSFKRLCSYQLKKILCFR